MTFHRPGGFHPPARAAAMDATAEPMQDADEPAGEPLFPEISPQISRRNLEAEGGPLSPWLREVQNDAAQLS